MVEDPQRALYIQEADQREKAARRNRELAKEETDGEKRMELIRQAEILEQDARNYRDLASKLVD
jgi:hypothetical protein